MAGNSSRHVWGIVIFIVALLFVSGIILPKLLYRHYFELRSELSTEHSLVLIDFDLLDETAVNEVNSTADDVNMINTEDLNQNSLSPMQPTSSVEESSILQIPTVKRSKRQAIDQHDNEYFAWSFNLNISRFKNPPTAMMAGSLNSDTDNPPKKDLDAAIYLSGNGPSQNYLQKSLESAGVFIRSVFGEGVQKLTNEEIQKVDDTLILKGNLQTDSDTQNSLTEESDKGATHSSESKRGGRFILGLLGFGRTSTAEPAKSTESKVTSENPVESSSILMSSDKNKTDLNIGKNIFEHTSTQSVDFNESLVTFQTELSTELEHTAVRLSCGTNDECLRRSIPEGVTEVAPEFQNVTGKEECINCDIPPALDKENEATLSATFDEVSSFSPRSFTDEKLEGFCMDLVHKLGESRIFLSDNSMEDGKSDESNLSTQSELDRLDCFKLLGVSEERKADEGIIEDSLLVNTDTSSNSASKDGEKDHRIISLFPFDFGSGRSELYQQMPDENTKFSTSKSVNTEESFKGEAKEAERDARIFNWFSFGFGSGRSEPDQQIIDEKSSNSASNRDGERDARIFDWDPLPFGSGRSGLDAENVGDFTNEPNTTETENEPTAKDCIDYFKKNQNVMMFPKPNLMDIISDSNIEIADFANATISPKLKEQQVQFIIDLLETSVKNCAVIKDERVLGNEKVVTGEKRLSTEKLPAEQKRTDTENEISTHTSISDFRQINTQVITDEVFTEIQQTEAQSDEIIFGFGSGNDASPGSDFQLFNSREGDKLPETLNTSEINLTENSNTLHSDFSEHRGTGCENDCFPENAFVDTAECSDDECHSGPLEQKVDTETVQNPTSNKHDCHDCSLFHNDSNVNEIGETISYSTSKSNEQILASSLVFLNDSYIKENDLKADFITGSSLNLECDNCSLSTELTLNKEFIVPFSKNSFQYLENLTTQNTGNCDDCEDRSQIGKEINDTELDSFNISPTSDSLSLKETTNSAKSSELHIVESVDTDHVNTDEIVTEFTNFQEELGNENNSRIFGPIFLTGSGDGGLFGNSGGRINLTEESPMSLEKLSQSNASQRRGRLDDALDLDPCDDCNIDFSDLQGKQDSEKEIVKPLETGDCDDCDIDLSDIQGNHQHIKGMNNNITLVKTGTSNADAEVKHRIGLFEDGGDDTPSLKELPNGSFSSEVLSESSLDFQDILTTVEPQRRPCSSASECNSELNERCLTTKNLTSICSCGRAFVRNRLTGKCVMKSSYKMDLKLPAEKFEKDLGDPITPRYKQKQEDANKLIYLLLKDKPNLIPIITEVTFAGFSPGSLILSWNLVLAVENETPMDVALLLRGDLTDSLLDVSLQEEVPFNVRNAYVLSISNAMDPCKSPELNYCDRNSRCVQNMNRPGGFECICKEEFFDVSNSAYPGEICEAHCSRDYCGSHGDCIWVAEVGRHCVCRDWYFGDRCGISGKIMVAGFSANIFLFMVFILVLVICKSRRRSRTYGNRRRGTGQLGSHAIAAGRVSDVIAMEENVGTTVAKISHISTPMQNNPVIQVTRPTLSESSITFYDDSTFDITPSSDSGQRNSEQGSAS